MNTIPYTLHRSKRKTIAIRILPDGGVEVRAPMRTPKYDIDRLIREKSDWITQKKQEAQTRTMLYPKHRFVEGEGFAFLGDTLFLTFSGAVKKPAREEDRLLIPQASPEAVKTMLEAWYKAEARVYFAQRLNLYAPRCGVTYRSLKLSSAEGRWGSCSTSGNINLTWRLVMAPADIIDYVVIHELCHIREPNHQTGFWSCVEAVLPNYNEKRAWLKTHARQLQF